MLERLADQDLLIAVALATLIIPAVFLALVGFTAYRRSRGREAGATVGSLIALSGGLSLGTLLLLSTDPVLAAPIIVVAAWVVAGRWRARRRRQVGWLSAGLGIPSAVVWGSLLAGPPGSVPSGDLPLTAAWASGGALVALVGLAIAVRGDPEPLPPSPAAPAGQPGSRALGSIAAAIREPAMIGPFGQPELAMLVAFVATWLIVPFLVPSSSPMLVRFLVPSFLAAAIGTEAYVRAWPARSRRAFEAFSWLGERELAQFRAIHGGRPPTSPEAAGRWLADHPEDSAVPDAFGGRVEVLLLAGRIDEARALVERMPRTAPRERFEQAACADLVQWQAGATGVEAEDGLAAMRRAADAIQPMDGDERLVAEVTIATALVRRRMADGRAAAGDAIEPLLEVRERLGRRADGQLGRALRPRLIPPLLLVSLCIALLAQLASGAGPIL